MPKVVLEINECTECPSFIYTIDKGCYCKDVGFEKMVEDKTWAKFNNAFHKGTLKVPKWCPSKV